MKVEKGKIVVVDGKIYNAGDELPIQAAPESETQKKKPKKKGGE